ncbi:MAG: TetR/AcrR family transcriptional regulator [Gammaproteobacteria bacterium]|nr:TetR/AcrR family transcriptional regulator [Gammaproteobacteria bacterium]
MARPIEYNQEQVLDKVMETFWLKGYEGTSVSDLVDATSLNTRTMYNLYGDKNGLFRAALDNYHDKIMGDFFTTLKQNEGLKGIRMIFDWVAENEMMNGCLFANTLSECNVIDKDCLGFVKDAFGKVEAQFAENLTQARKAGEFNGDLKATSKLLLLIMQGMSVFSKTRPTKTERKKMIDSALTILSAN